MLLALEFRILFFAKPDIIRNPANRQSLAGKPAALGVTGAARAPDVAELMKRQRLDVIGSSPCRIRDAPENRSRQMGGRGEDRGHQGRLTRDG
jgi:hypothetical protein